MLCGERFCFACSVFPPSFVVCWCCCRHQFTCHAENLRVFLSRVQRKSLVKPKRWKLVLSESETQKWADKKKLLRFGRRWDGKMNKPERRFLADDDVDDINGEKSVFFRLFGAKMTIRRASFFARNFCLLFFFSQWPKICLFVWPKTNFSFCSLLTENAKFTARRETNKKKIAKGFLNDQKVFSFSCFGSPKRLSL